jgi:hypothetical protein
LSALADTARFIGVLTGGGLIEIRHKQPSGKWWSVYFDDPVEAACYALRTGLGLDTYVCGAPSAVRRGGWEAARDEDVAQAWAPFADCDTDAALDALAAFEPQPSIVVASGNLTERKRAKLHAYWLLVEPVEAAGFRAAKHKLAHHLGSDASVKNESRIVRALGTRNFKHDPDGRPVRALRFEPERRYTLDQVVGHLADPPEPRFRPAEPIDLSAFPPEQVADYLLVQRRRASDPLRRVPADVWYRALTGQEPLTSWTLWRSRGKRVRKALCPLHGDSRTPNLLLFEDGGWWCEKEAEDGKRPCGGGENVYSFWARWKGIDAPIVGPLRRQLTAAVLGEAVP